jgi:hypothetical protein
MAADLEGARSLQGTLAVEAIGKIEAEFALVVCALEAIAATRLASV